MASKLWAIFTHLPFPSFFKHTHTHISSAVIWRNQPAKWIIFSFLFFFNSSQCKHQTVYIMVSVVSCVMNFLCLNNVMLFMLFMCVRVCVCVWPNSILKAHFGEENYGERFRFCVHISKTWPLNRISNDVSKNFRNLFHNIFAPSIHIQYLPREKEWAEKDRKNSDMSIFEPPLYAFTKFFSYIQNILIRFCV